MALTCTCGERLDLAALLDAAPKDATGQSRMLYVTCPHCKEPVELRLGGGRVEVGYTYYAGSSHFEVLHTSRVSGLKVKPSEPDDLDVSLRDRHWHFAVRGLSHLRFCVLVAAFARGKKIGDLDFAQWGVRLAAFERGFARSEPDPGLVLEYGDFLHLEGHAPALTRAWLYMNDGVDLRKPRPRG